MEESYQKALEESYHEAGEAEARRLHQEYEASAGVCDCCGGVTHYGWCDDALCRSVAIIARFDPHEDDWVCRDHEAGREECVHEWLYDILDRCDLHLIRQCGVCSRVERQTVVEDDEY